MSRGTSLIRVLTALRLLARPGGVSLAELEQEFGVGKRTVQRDLDVLDAAGFKILDIPDSWPLRKRTADDVVRTGALGVQTSELLALRLAQHLLGGMGSRDLADGIAALASKLRSLASPLVRNQMARLEAAGATRLPASSPPSAAGVMGVILSAVADCRVLRIDYATRSLPGRRWREIEPYDLTMRKSGLYVVGPDAGSREPKSFLLSRIHGAELTARQFKRPATFSAERHFADRFGVHGGEPRLVRVVFDAEAASYVRGKCWHESQRLVERGEGTLELTMRVAGMPEVKSWLQSFGAAARVLAPRDLADAIVREARLIAARGDAGTPVAEGHVAELRPASPKRGSLEAPTSAEG